MYYKERRWVLIGKVMKMKSASDLNLPKELLMVVAMTARRTRVIHLKDHTMDYGTKLVIMWNG